MVCLSWPIPLRVLAMVSTGRLVSRQDPGSDLPMPSGDSLAAHGSKPRRSPLRHVEADHLAAGQ